MNVDEAIKTFEYLRNSRFSKDDISVIKEVAAFLGVAEFKMQNAESGGDHFHDFDDQMHVHPTMIVARKQFPNSIDRGRDPFPKFPFFIELSKWSGSKGGKSIATEIPHVVCPVSTASVPAGQECGYCGEVHYE